MKENFFVLNDNYSKIIKDPKCYTAEELLIRLNEMGDKSIAFVTETDFYNAHTGETSPIYNVIELQEGE